MLWRVATVGGLSAGMITVVAENGVVVGDGRLTDWVSMGVLVNSAPLGGERVTLCYYLPLGYVVSGAATLEGCAAVGSMEAPAHCGSRAGRTASAVIDVELGLRLPCAARIRLSNRLG